MIHILMFKDLMINFRENSIKFIHFLLTIEHYTMTKNKLITCFNSTQFPVDSVNSAVLGIVAVSDGNPT